MAFIDNSKDIIIDAVLTDLGRQRMAQGRFNIARFALGDDEINYGLYNPNHPQGSAYSDLELLKTPVFEAFTNNISTMNSRLVTYTNNTLFYLPVIKLNTEGGNVTSKIEGNQAGINGGFTQYFNSNIGSTFLVPVNSETYNSFSSDDRKNIIEGYKVDHKNYIRLDQGIDNADATVSNTLPIEQELLEEQFTLELDNRFGFITFEGNKLEPTFIDDDNIALYSFNNFDDVPYITKLALYSSSDTSTQSGHVLAGKRGNSLRFGIYASDVIQSANTTLFNLYGVSVTIGSNNFNVIHTTATVTGLKTGYSIDIPVSFIKKI